MASDVLLDGKIAQTVRFAVLRHAAGLSAKLEIPYRLLADAIARKHAVGGLA